MNKNFLNTLSLTAFSFVALLSSNCAYGDVDPCLKKCWEGRKACADECHKKPIEAHTQCHPMCQLSMIKCENQCKKP